MSALTAVNVLQALSRHIGARNGISAARLVEAVLQTPSHTATERHLREIVTALRLDGHHICAHPETGYFIAETAEELDATCAFLYERALASLTQVARMKKISLPDLRGQLHLPT